jgi:L-lactate dehydrogenase complex protein LldE
MPTVSLFVTCLTDQFYPEVAVSVVRVLRRLGIAVDFPKAQTCCGQPALNSGYFDEARSVARRMIDVFEQSDVVVTPSGSCCAMVREHFAHLFKDDARLHARAVALAAKTFDFVEYLEKILRIDWSAWDLAYDGIATYHYSCHLRGIGMTDETTRLLKRIRGMEYRPLEKIEQCCGFGGTFAVKYGDISGAMVRDKVACIAATRANLLVSNDGGCTMNIAGACRRAGLDIEIRHIAQILDAAMQRADSDSRSPGRKDSEVLA